MQFQTNLKNKIKDEAQRKMNHFKQFFIFYIFYLFLNRTQMYSLMARRVPQIAH